MTEERLAEPIRSLLPEGQDGHIEEVIKVDQTAVQVVRQEIRDYIVTAAIERNLVSILERYGETPNKPHEGIGVWVSGFFGSGKSSFAKMLGYALGDRPLGDERASRLLAERAGGERVKLLLTLINQRIPTHTVIFDVSTHRGIKSGAQPLTETMYRLFLGSLDYADNIDLAELEIALEEEGRLEAFAACYRDLYGAEWDAKKTRYALAFGEASRVMHTLDPHTWPQPDSWVRAAQNRAEISPDRMAARCVALLDRRKPGHALVFVIDEVGQFVAKDGQKMLELQGIIHSLGTHGRGRLWLVATSQERLNEVVSGLDDTRIELARLMDRFATQVHLENSDIAEVTAKRVLRKTKAGQTRLRELFEAWRGRLLGTVRVHGNVPLTELTPDGFAGLYPLLPHQIDLVIQVVSGLRTQGGAAQHVGGANRTVIKLAHALLYDPRVRMVDRPTGALVTFDGVYDLVENNVSSDMRAKIAEVAAALRDTPLAAAVAKAVCLLQYSRAIPATEENLAAVLHPAIDAESLVSAVREALRAMADRQMVRQGENGWRIPTPAEDDWEKTRRQIPARGIGITIAAALKAMWEAAPPQHVLEGCKTFRGGLIVDGKTQTEGDLAFHVHTADRGRLHAELSEELRKRSQRERKAVFWAVAIDADIQREAEEAFRSQEVIKIQAARPNVDGKLLADEKRRLTFHHDELRRRLKAACLDGQVWFEGNDRNPSQRATDFARAAAEVLGRVLPQVFHRFGEAAAKAGQGDIDTLLKSETLHGLSSVVARLRLVRDEGGIPVFETDTGPLKEVLSRIGNRTGYGETASGRWLAEEFANEPFGWDFDMVRLFALCLLRAGRIEATSQGRTFDAALSVEAKSTFSNNNLFRGAAFRPRVGLEKAQIVAAADHFQQVFGERMRELGEAPVAAAIRRRLAAEEPGMQEQCDLLTRHALPGLAVLRQGLEQARGILRGSDAQAIQGFNAAWATLKDVIRRAGEMERVATPVAIDRAVRARHLLGVWWPQMSGEPDIDDDLRDAARELAVLAEGDEWYNGNVRMQGLLDRLTVARDQTWLAVALDAADANRAALARLEAHPSWPRL
ncbi:MAG: BREX system P-loop protein BrxC, partial [Alphaproteobacteria bacterium]|nr:BREX system P-loop protein BrxC [Alphaproteobacteria bacterium]